MKEIGKVNIINAEYRVYLHNDLKEVNEYYDKANKACEIEERTEKLETVDGYCDYRTREIHILKDEGMKDDFLKGILFHELTHCMLYQMGDKCHNDEEYVEKIAKFATILNDISKEINDKLTK